MTMILLIFIMMVFILFEASGLPRKLKRAFGWRPEQLARMSEAQREIQRYLGIKTLVSLATGIVFASLIILFLVPALSLAGIPPLSGFWAKLAVIQAAVMSHAWLAVGAALFAGLLTLLSMTKIWNEAFWKPRPVSADESGPPPASVPASLFGPVLALAAVTVAVGLGAGPVFELASRAAAQLSDPAQYIAAVLGPGGVR